MTNITRFEPLNDLVRFEPLWDMDEFFRMPTMRGLWRTLPEMPQFKTDVSEDEKFYHMKADIPGMTKEDIKVSIDGNQVTISTNVKKAKEEKKGERIIRSERYYGNQVRAFTLEHDVDGTKAEAKYENGVLFLTLPKKELTSAKQVIVN